VARLKLNGLHDVIYQKMVLFITTAVKTSNPTKENLFSREIMCLLKTSRDLQMLFVAVTYIAEGLSFETLLTLKVEKSLICLVGTRRPTVSIIEQVSFVLENVN
jgi:hypothetical protein